MDCIDTTVCIYLFYNILLFTMKIHSCDFLKAWLLANIFHALYQDHTNYCERKGVSSKTLQLT